MLKEKCGRTSGSLKPLLFTGPIELDFSKGNSNVVSTSIQGFWMLLTFDERFSNGFVPAEISGYCEIVTLTRLDICAGYLPYFRSSLRSMLFLSHVEKLSGG